MKKRFISILLALCLMLPLIPVTGVVAADNTTSEIKLKYGTTNTPDRSNENAINLFDGDVKTKWCFNQQKYRVGIYNFNPYVKFSLDESQTVVSYTLTTGNDTASHSGRNPISWRLYGSNVDYVATSSKWVLLDERTNDHTLGAENNKAYSFGLPDNMKSYRYYMLEIVANGGDSLTQLSEVSFDYYNGEEARWYMRELKYDNSTGKYYKGDNWIYQESGTVAQMMDNAEYYSFTMKWFVVKDFEDARCNLEAEDMKIVLMRDCDFGATLCTNRTLTGFEPGTSNMVTYEYNYKCILDLNGHVITAPKDAAAFYLGRNGRIIVTDSNPMAYHKTHGYGGFIVGNGAKVIETESFRDPITHGGELVLESGTIGSHASGTGSDPTIVNGGQFYMNGGVVYSGFTNSAVYNRENSYVGSMAIASFYMNGGTIKHPYNGFGMTKAAVNIVYGSAVLSGGEISGFTINSENTAAAVHIGDGTRVTIGANMLISGCTNRSSNGAGGIYVGDRCVLEMESGIIRNCSTTGTFGAGGVYVAAGGSINMPGGTIDNCTSTAGAGGIYLAKGATFGRYAGYITNCSVTGEDSAGGLHISDGCTVETFGGAIDGCSASASGSAGGVRVAENATFTMYNGDIKNCTTSAEHSAGAVVICEDGVFNMTGGVTIDNCSSTASINEYRSVGGVLINGVGVFNMKDNSVIQNCTAAPSNNGYRPGAVLLSNYKVGDSELYNGSEFYMSGNAIIRNCTGGGLKAAVYSSGVVVMESGLFSIKDNAKVIDCKAVETVGSEAVDAPAVTNREDMEIDGGTIDGLLMLGGGALNTVENEAKRTKFTGTVINGMSAGGETYRVFGGDFSGAETIRDVNKVTFIAEGVENVPAVQWRRNTYATKPADPVSTGEFAFEYWYENDINTPYNFNTFITKDTTLRAKWRSTHVCSFEDEWSGDNSYHWHDCVGVSCSEVSDKGAHQLTKVVDGKYLASKANCTSSATYYESCTVCNRAVTNRTFTSGEPNPANHSGTAEKWGYDENQHWHCYTCHPSVIVGEKSAHMMENGKCASCGYLCAHNSVVKATDADGNELDSYVCTKCNAQMNFKVDLSGYYISQTSYYVDADRAFEQANNSGSTATVTLLSDVSITNTINITEDVTLLLGGNTLTKTTDGSAFSVKSGAEFTVENEVENSDDTVVKPDPDTDPIKNPEPDPNPIIKPDPVIVPVINPQSVEPDEPVESDEPSTTPMGSIVGGTANAYGEAVYIDNGGMFTLKDGDIRGSVNVSGTFKMDGGKLSVRGTTSSNGNKLNISPIGVMFADGGTVECDVNVESDLVNSKYGTIKKTTSDTAIVLPGIPVDDDSDTSTEFSGEVTNNGDILTGRYSGVVTNAFGLGIFRGGNISGGSFLVGSTVNNKGNATISGGSFSGTVLNSTDGIVSGGNFESALTSNIVKVVFDANGGANAPTAQWRANATISNTTTPVNPGKRFLCWTTKKDDVLTEWQFTTNVGAESKIFTLTAYWSACRHSTKMDTRERDSTCTDKGWDAYKTCISCFAIFDADGNLLADGIPYRQLKPHSYTQSVMKDETKKSDANCQSAEMYYKSCSCGAISNSNSDIFTNGLPDPSSHTGVLGESYEKNAEKHWKEWSCCHAHESENEHRGGSATCKSQAECIDCGEKYGSLGGHDFTGGYYKTADGHAKTCATAGCGEHDVITPHNYDDDRDTDCNLCGYVRTVSYTVTFDANGGSNSMASSATGTDGKLVSLPTPTRIGSWRFDGWFTASSGGDAVGLDHVYTADTTIYAHWTLLGAPVEPGSFDDVPDGSYFEDPVDWAVGNGITNGITKDLFCPDMNCTRAQTVVLLWRTAGCPQATTGDMQFTDVTEGSYYYEAVLWAIEQGITNGINATTFAPDMECTRAQILTFIWRFLGCPEGGEVNPFTDVNESFYYAEPILWGVKEGVTDGMTPTTFCPDLECTRAQIVTFIYRALVE